jgi:hypothetical protein
MAAVPSLQPIGPQSSVQVISRRLPVSGALIAAIILFMVAALGVGVTASGNSVIVTDGPTGPLDVYAAIMPGQPLSVLEAFDCGTTYPNNTSLAAFYCTIRPEYGPIRSISVSGANGKIESLTMRMSDVRVGDLIEHWGHPDLTRVFKRSFTLAWDEGIYVIGSLRGRFNYWSPATYVLVMSLED